MSGARFDDVTVIVRECGERTVEACMARLTEIFGYPPLSVSARPFHATLRQALELGLEQGRPWTLCIDADVLALPGLTHFIELARAPSRQIFEAQALIVDKLLPVRRPAGNHLYRTSLIERALPLIPIAGSLRPESDMILAMAALGFGAWQSSIVIGLHDFEQNHEDIYRKALLHGRKHDYLIPIFRPIWETLAGRDADFRLALQALDDAIAFVGTPDISRDFGALAADEAVSRLRLPGKGLLKALSRKDVDILLAQHTRMLSGLDESIELLQRSMYVEDGGAVITAAPAPRTSPLAYARNFLRRLFAAAGFDGKCNSPRQGS